MICDALAYCCGNRCKNEKRHPASGIRGGGKDGELRRIAQKLRGEKMEKQNEK